MTVRDDPVSKCLTTGYDVMTILFLVPVSRPIDVLININQEQRIKYFLLRNPNSPVETFK